MKIKQRNEQKINENNPTSVTGKSIKYSIFKKTEYLFKKLTRIYSVNVGKK